MAIFGKDGFIRKQETALAKKLLVWRYEKAGSVLPDDEVLTAFAQKVVDDAHRIAKESGKSVLEIIKERVREIKDKKRS